MSNISVYDELDQAIDQMLQPQLASPFFPQRARNGWGPQNRCDRGAPPETAENTGEENIRELVELAADLRDLPRTNFKSRLKLELEMGSRGAATVSATETDRQAARGVTMASGEILPSLFGKTWTGYPVRRINFALSAALHGVMAFLIGAGFLMVKSYVPRVEPQPSVTVRLEPYLVPLGSHPSSGGGSGGAADRMRASAGVAPPAAREQLTPPIVRRAVSEPPLAAAATVIAPPDLAVPRTQEIGDPLSALTKPSNGPGVAGRMAAVLAAEWAVIRRLWPRTGSGGGLLRRSLFRGERREHAARDLCSRAGVFRGSAHCEVPGRGDAAGDDWHGRPRQKPYRCAVAGHGAGPESAGCGAHVEV